MPLTLSRVALAKKDGTERIPGNLGILYPLR